MKPSVFFIRPPEYGTRLRDVAVEVFDALRVCKWEERNSSNYPPDEHYFIGYCENAEVIVADGDDEQTADHPFHVHVEYSSRHHGSGIIATDVETLVKALVARGFVVFVPTGDWTEADWNRDGDEYVG